jgi:hypothetical protein
MTTPTRNWRIRPNTAIEYAVEHMARCEGRSLSNMLGRLLDEAIDARRAAQAKAQAHDVDRLVAMMKSSSAEAPHSKLISRLAASDVRV